jgi:uncharacterized membrane protein YfcA
VETLGEQVSSASAAFTMFFTAFSTSMQFSLYGMLDWEESMVLPLIGVAGAFVGNKGIGQLVRRYHRLSLMLLPLVAVMALSTILMVRRAPRPAALPCTPVAGAGTLPSP